MTPIGEFVLAVASKLDMGYAETVIYMVSCILVASLLAIAKAQHVSIKPEHKRNIALSKKVHRQIQRTPDNALRMKIMRDIHPNVFEELLLTALKSPMRKVKRNQRYTGDGGLDGKVRIHGQWHLVQAKRYSNHIDPNHVKEFVDLCRREGCPGLFIHTGKTGEKSRDIIRNADNCTMISGQALCAMVGGEIKIETLLDQAI